MAFSPKHFEASFLKHVQRLKCLFHKVKSFVSSIIIESQSHLLLPSDKLFNLILMTNASDHH